MNECMKAIVCTAYGPPDVLQLKEVAKPMPGDNEVRVRIHAAAVGPADCAFRKGEPFVVKLLFGLRRPKFEIPGGVFAGKIESVGKDVTLYKEGDAIFGITPHTFGAHAEYICLPEDGDLAPKPANITYEEAAGICDGAATALTFLRDIANVQRGQRVLINGASGAVGTSAVQLAKVYGAEVTGVCSTTNLEMVKSLGADHIIDYTREDFTQSGQTYDVIFDAVGKSSFARCRSSLTQNGVYLTTVPTLTIVGQMLWTAIVGRKRAKFTTAGLKQNRENLLFLKDLFETGKIKLIIDRRYPLEQIADAHRYVDKGHKKGNVVITM